jgi:hypothetical protein
MSSFAWLDYSEHERRRALDVIEQFREQEARDELGIGVIRDGFADLFFPGTGTVQTRARYFFFVPWIYKRLEQKKVGSHEVRAKARRAEVELIEKLLESGETEGVIGRVRKAGLKRLPSSIYWQGLGVLGVRRFQGSQDRYHRSLDRYYQGGLSLRADDGELLDRPSAFNWDAALPPAPAGFPDGADLQLTAPEADYLRERITHARPNSLFRYFADLEDEPPELGFPWEHPALDGAPAILCDQLEHARNFSEVIQGAALLYNLILSRLSKSEDLVSAYVEELQGWALALREREAAHRVWNREAFWKVVASTQANVSFQTREFVNRWLDLALAGRPESIPESERAETLIRAREILLKRRQARVNGGRALELWQGASGTRALNYRWPIAYRVLSDMYFARVGA